MKVDRETRLQHAKAIGRAAYRIVRASKIEGFLDLRDGRKCHRECNRGGLIIELLEAAHLTPHWSDFSQLRIRCAGRKVFEIHWNGGGLFKITKFEPGAWLQMLQILADAALPRCL